MHHLLTIFPPSPSSQVGRSQPQLSPPPIMSSLMHPHSPSSGGVPDVVHAPLSPENYKSKFTELLKLEEIEHHAEGA